MASRITFALAFNFLRVNPASLRANGEWDDSGVVQDQQGAVIGKANVLAKSLDTGAVHTAASDDSDNYRIVSVPAGSYEVSVTAPAFKTEAQSGIVVTAGGERGVNFALTVGAVTEKAEVTAEAAQTDTFSSTPAGFVNANTIRELPLNGRDWGAPRPARQ